MANLIITIISIGLVAIAAIMGAYYGGAAFMNAQVKPTQTRWLIMLLRSLLQCSYGHPQMAAIQAAQHSTPSEEPSLYKATLA
jgi:RsiW-degrading membrane proteinase PrsW (M82 family)